MNQTAVVVDINFLSFDLDNLLGAEEFAVIFTKNANIVSWLDGASGSGWGSREQCLTNT